MSARVYLIRIGANGEIPEQILLEHLRDAMGSFELVQPITVDLFSNGGYIARDGEAVRVSEIRGGGYSPGRGGVAMNVQLSDADRAMLQRIAQAPVRLSMTSPDPGAVYPSTSVRNHPFEGPEVFDDTPRDPWPTTAAAVEALRERRNGV